MVKESLVGPTRWKCESSGVTGRLSWRCNFSLSLVTGEPVSVKAEHGMWPFRDGIINEVLIALDEICFIINWGKCTNSVVVNFYDGKVMVYLFWWSFMRLYTSLPCSCSKFFRISAYVFSLHSTKALFV